MNKSLSIGEVFRFAWRAFKDNALVLVLLTLMYVVIQVLFAIPACGHEAMMKHPEPEKAGFCGFYQLIHSIINVFMMMGFATVGLFAAQGEKVTFAQFFSKFNKFFHYVVAMILFTIIFAVGLVLFIVPGIIWGLKYCMYPFAVLDKGAFGWTALQLSNQATYGVKWELLGFYIIIFLLMLAGILTFGLGLFIVLPLTWVAQAYIWKKLIGESS